MKTSKILLTASACGILLLTGACAEKSVRPAALHNHMKMHHQHRQPMSPEEMREHMQSMMPMEQVIEKARTPADHQAIASRYEMEAERLLRLARRHERLAETYARTDNPKMAGDSARHCRNIAQRLREAAEEMQSLAQMHWQMGGQR